MKKGALILLLVLSLVACQFSGEETTNLATPDEETASPPDEESISLPEYARYCIKRPEDLGYGRGILKINGDNKWALLTDSTSPDGLYYRKLNLETRRTEKLMNPIHCVIASGDDLLLEGRYYYFTNCARDDKRIIYRLDAEEGLLEIIEERAMEDAGTHPDSPFIYFSVFDDEKILWVETNTDASHIKLHNRTDGSTRIIASYPNVPADETEEGVRRYFVDTYVYESRIYALVGETDTSRQNHYMILELDETGREWGSYDLGDLAGRLRSGPLCMDGNRNYIMIRYWSGVEEIYRLDPDGYTVEKVVDAADDFFALVGMEYNYHKDCTRYIFMRKQNTNENKLYALDTETGVILSKTLVADEGYPCIDSGIMDENQSLLLSYAALTEEGYRNSRKNVEYYLPREVVEEIFATGTVVVRENK